MAFTLSLHACPHKSQRITGQLSTGARHGATGQQNKDSWVSTVHSIALQPSILQRLKETSQRLANKDRPPGRKSGPGDEGSWAKIQNDLCNVSQKRLEGHDPSFSDFLDLLPLKCLGETVLNSFGADILIKKQGCKIDTGARLGVFRLCEELNMNDPMNTGIFPLPQKLFKPHTS